MTLAAAFAELRRKHNVIARQSFWCCMGCGCNAIGIMVEAMPPAERPKGYVFYHKQDTELWRERGSVYLTFGATDDGGKPRRTVEIGKLVQSVLAAHGCPVEWDGTAGTKLLAWRDENTRREYAAKLLGHEISKSA
jgi:hypothetical protein